ncbi:MAG: hypothetical protein M1834_004457 [Cirrosporium novae-zelandiae]|nr:MAG: hypothetical protein M1834_004457 [Cirrosporium novae-zelandiae]
MSLKLPAVCEAFAKQGDCWHGDSCVYQHPLDSINDAAVAAPVSVLESSTAPKSKAHHHRQCLMDSTDDRLNTTLGNLFSLKEHGHRPLTGSGKVGTKNIDVFSKPNSTSTSATFKEMKKGNVRPSSSGLGFNRTDGHISSTADGSGHKGGFPGDATTKLVTGLEESRFAKKNSSLREMRSDGKFLSFAKHLWNNKS